MILNKNLDIWNSKTMFEKLDFYFDFLNQLKEMFKDNDMPIVITTSGLEKPDPRIIWVNSKFCEKTGYSLNELIGESPRKLQGDKTNKEMLKELKRVIKRGDKYTGITVNYKKDKTPYLVQLVIKPLYDFDGNLSNYIALHHIVSEKIEDIDKIKWE